MLAMEQILSELNGEELNEQGLPPGFRFHPTDEELITFYLASKVFKGSFCGVEIAEVDLNRCEPWELPGTNYIHDSHHLSHDLMQHSSGKSEVCGYLCYQECSYQLLIIFVSCCDSRLPAADSLY